MRYCLFEIAQGRGREVDLKVVLSTKFRKIGHLVLPERFLAKLFIGSEARTEPSSVKWVVRMNVRNYVHVHLPWEG